MSRQERQDRIREQLGDIGSGETHGTISGGHFSFTPDEMRKIINNWKELADSYNDSIRNARPMVLIEQPAEDFASRFFTKGANESGQSYLTYCQHNRDYCLEQAQLFQDALDDYLGAEERTVVALGDVGEGGPQPGL